MHHRSPGETIAQIVSNATLRQSLDAYLLEAIDTTTGYVRQRGSKERHTVGLRHRGYDSGEGHGGTKGLQDAEEGAPLRRGMRSGIMLV